MMKLTVKIDKIHINNIKKLLCKKRDNFNY